jgi:hypothetical protein
MRIRCQLVRLVRLRVCREYEVDITGFLSVCGRTLVSLTFHLDWGSKQLRLVDTMKRLSTYLACQCHGARNQLSRLDVACSHHAKLA